MGVVSNRSQVHQQFAAAIKHVRNEAQRRVRKVANEVLDGVVDATPKDKHHAIGNWQVGIATTPEGEIPGSDVGGTGAKAAGHSAIAAAPFGQPINIVNNVPYIGKLNDGSSAQAPANFVEREVSKAVGRANQ